MQPEIDIVLAMTKPSAENGKLAYQRRSKRVRAKIPVVVRMQNVDHHTVTEKTDALVVSAHGGLILLSSVPSPDQFITVANPRTGEELLSRVTAVGPTIMGKTEIGIEFIKPAPSFWGLPSPPEDWKLARIPARAHKPKAPSPPSQASPKSQKT